MDGTIKKLRSNPYYIPSDKQGEEIWKVEQEEQMEKEEMKKQIIYDVLPVHDNSLPIHNVKVTKTKRKKYERKQTDRK